MASLFERSPGRGLSGVILGGVDRAIVARWEPALARAQSTTGDELDARVKSVARAFAKELAVVGAAAGGAAAMPGTGTAAGLALTATELGVYTARVADLILTIAVLHGHDDADIEERRAWVLAVLAFGDGAAQSVTKLAGELGIGLGKRATAAIPTEGLRALNRALGRTIVTKYGTKRGALALGHVLPFGIGAVVGGGGNYAMTRLVARHADGLFRDLART